jgi:glycosyltransferase involved in cell wall biosynthesis
LKLLFVIPEYPPHAGGGIITWYKNLLPELVSQGHSVHLLVGSALSPKFPSYEADGIKVDFLDHDEVTKNLSKFEHYQIIPEFQRHLAASWTAWEQVNGGNGYDLVETTDWGLLFVPWVIQQDSPPVVVQLHGSIGQIDFYDPKPGDELQGTLVRLLEMQLLSIADEVQTYSRNNAEEWTSLLGRKVTYIPPAFNLPRTTDTSNINEKHGLVVGRIQHWKGPSLLCEGLRLLGEDAPTIEWVGRDTPFQDKSSFSAYLQQIYPDVWGSKLVPVGPRTPEETTSLQDSAEFIVVPSLWDVFNFTCVEAMGHAKVVLCSKGAGASDLIEDGVNGLSYPTDAPLAISEKIRQLQNMSFESRLQMGKLARQTVEEVLAPNTIAQQRSQIYRGLVQRGRYSTNPNKWVTQAVIPQQNRSQPFAILDRLPLKQLAHYTLRRSWKKTLSK